MRIRRPYIPIVILCLALVSQARRKDEKITGNAFVKREVLVDILVDIHLMDGIAQDRQFSRKYDVDSIDVLSPILAKHQVSRQMFDTTMYEYTRNPGLLDEVYNDVLIKLNMMLDENSKEEEANIEEL